jgi:PAS domain-containing protein
LLGYTAEELPTVREVWDALAHPGDVAVYRKKLMAHIKDPHVPFETIIRLRHKSGAWRWNLARWPMVNRPYCCACVTAALE